MIEALEKEIFTPLLNDKFEVYPIGMDKVEVELVQITEKSTGFSEGFSLLFRGPRDNVFPHDTHKIKHSKVGEFELFIGPIMYPKTDGVYYEVIVNRLKKDE
jgi:hypothetical protein